MQINPCFIPTSSNLNPVWCDGVGRNSALVCANRISRGYSSNRTLVERGGGSQRGRANERCEASRVFAPSPLELKGLCPFNNIISLESLIMKYIAALVIIEYGISLSSKCGYISFRISVMSAGSSSKTTSEIILQFVPS